MEEKEVFCLLLSSSRKKFERLQVFRFSGKKTHLIKISTTPMQMATSRKNRDIPKKTMVLLLIFSSLF